MQSMFRNILFLTEPNIPVNATWSQNGSTVISGLGKPLALCIDEDQKLLVTELDNHRIIEYNMNGREEKVIAGGNGKGNGSYQLNEPRNIAIDKRNNSLIICDFGNRRVVRWSRQNNTQEGDVLLDNIECFGLALDEQRNLYVCDADKHEVRWYRLGDRNGTLVAGGNGGGLDLNQLQSPTYLFVDREQNVYVSDNFNHRVMKWGRDANSGIIIAGGNGIGDFRNQSTHPDGISVDIDGTLYVVESQNQREMRWHHGAQEGSVIVGGHGLGQVADQLHYPSSLAFDRHGNLYVTDTANRRIQRFAIQ